MDVVGGVEVGQTRRDVLEQRVYLLEGQVSLARVDVLGLVGVPLGFSPHLGFQLLLGGLLRLAARNVEQEVAAVAVLLEDEDAGDARTEAVQLDVLQPDVAVRDEVGVGELGQELDLDKDCRRQSRRRRRRRRDETHLSLTTRGRRPPARACTQTALPRVSPDRRAGSAGAHLSGIRRSRGGRA